MINLFFDSIVVVMNILLVFLNLYSLNWKEQNLTYYSRYISKDHGWTLKIEVHIKGSH